MYRYLLRAAIMTTVVTLAGCTTLDPQTGERRIDKTRTGALAGAATGVVAGGIAGSTKAAIIGAGVGALAGAAVGNYMDRQEAELREDLEGTGVEVERVGDNIALRMPSSVTFDTGKAQIKPEFYPVLDEISETLARYESTVVNIAGHTDSVGSAQYNQTLSENRANSVRDYLIRRGVLSQRILTTGYGESLPVAENDTEYGRQQNRRVEITLQPVTE